eukprot:TRINITY_DN6165_c0_g1_i1.p2 TRINITY_DN6165_c0_g1~~TRINITY_DN6165_c0_g1_i1.p2  ORF type:complete len:1113 (-),score=272.03 TRINITY_DN6165_c0_g1_i1:5404-8742(-)
MASVLRQSAALAEVGNQARGGGWHVRSPIRSQGPQKTRSHQKMEMSVRAVLPSSAQCPLPAGSTSNSSTHFIPSSSHAACRRASTVASATEKKGGAGGFFSNLRSSAGLSNSLAEAAAAAATGKSTQEEIEQQASELLLEAQLAAERDTREAAEQLFAEREQQSRDLEKLKLREAQLIAMVEERDRQLAELAAEKKKAQVEKLQVQNEVSGGLCFCYPEVAKAGSDVDIFFHRKISKLSDEPTVSIMGGFNDWQWKSFRTDLQPCDQLGNDWWVVTVSVPPEAYIINFVFHSADKVFENNGEKDFTVAAEGGLGQLQFEEMILVEKRREALMRAEVEAEKERIAAEEKRRIEQERKIAADKKQAREKAEEARAAASVSYSKALGSLMGVWYTEPQVMVPGQTAKFFYNRSWRPLWNTPQVWLHAGHNNWQSGVDLIAEMKFDNFDGGDWWSTEIMVPEDAFMLNWVLADGPPNTAYTFDNNNMEDYAAVVGGPEAEAEHFAQMETKLLVELEEARVKAEAVAAAAAERRSQVRARMREQTKEAFLRAQQHVLYTEPRQVQASSEVKVFYNPENTVLNGCPEIWIRGSFNRWTHRSGGFPAKRMVPAPTGTHLQANVTVPHDAYCMDFVFSTTGSTAEGGFYDNKGGLDYHVPVEGSTTEAPPLHVVHIAIEMAPIAKVGGLGDVVTSLSRAVQEGRHQVEVVMPKYDVINYSLVHNLEERDSFFWGGTTIRCWHGYVEGVPVNFLEPQSGIFWVGCIYGRKDDAGRFGFFCHAALEFLLQSGRQPDIIHCHDWSSAPSVWLFAEQYRFYGLANARTVFTIHNLEFGQPLIGRAMAACDKATTVSPTYAWEVGSNGAISPHLGKFHGIINGIDQDIWDPLGDDFIPMKYDSHDVVEGKRAARRALQSRLGLRWGDDFPIVGVVTRLTAQKGIDLIKAGMWKTLERGGQFVLLGSAPDGRVQADFQNLAGQLSRTHGDMARLWLSYDEPLSHLIYAGCDMILVPSIFEPCGLTQMIAMRYGSIPVVRRTGGLNDTVFDVDNDKERARLAGIEVNGFNFEGADSAGMDYAMNRAISAWYDGRDWWNSLAARVMEQDWSWNRPALDYLELYYGARK